MTEDKQLIINDMRGVYSSKCCYLYFYSCTGFWILSCLQCNDSICSVISLLTFTFLSCKNLSSLPLSLLLTFFYYLSVSLFHLFLFSLFNAFSFYSILPPYSFFINHYLFYTLCQFKIVTKIKYEN